MKEEREIFSGLAEFLKDLFPGKNSIRELAVVAAVVIAVCLFLFALYFLVLLINDWLVRKHTASYIRKLPLIADITEMDAPEDEKYSLVDLVIKCVGEGVLIDKHTDRRHHSKEVSDRIYRMCTVLGLPALEKTVYTCTGYVYDMGFIEIPDNFFQQEIISADEIRKIRTHVMNSFSYFSYVPDAYRSIFLNAAVFHHENYDGSGYPEGLSGEDIPFEARLIRICESYVSMTSSRSYHRRLSSADAIAELRHSENLYGPEMIELLVKSL